MTFLISRTALAFLVGIATVTTSVVASHQETEDNRHAKKYDIINTARSSDSFTSLVFRAFKSMNTKTDDISGQHVDKDSLSRRDLKGSNANKWKKKYEECEAELEKPHYLYVQMADKCTLTKRGKNRYTLSSEEFAPTTWSFEDRPLRYESEMKTKDFVQSFDSIFDGEGGSPNAAITFVHEDSGEFDGPLVTAFIDVVKKHKANGKMKVTYKLRQSKSQADVYSLDDFFEGDDDIAEYEDCSVFIDSGSSVNCGNGKSASSCSKCPSSTCSGDCVKFLGCTGGNKNCCKAKQINCGNNAYANSCAECPESSCMGDCQKLLGCSGGNANCCKEKTCLDYNSKSSCEGKSGCFWVAQFADDCTACAPTGYMCEACTDFTDYEECNNYGCTWTNTFHNKNCEACAPTGGTCS